MRMCVKPGNAMLFEDNTGFYQLFFRVLHAGSVQIPIWPRTVKALFRHTDPPGSL